MLKSFIVNFISNFRNTAYFGFKETCQPKAGEVVVVGNAADAVGSHFAQLARNMGEYYLF